MFIAAVFLLLLIPFKMVLFYGLFTRFRLMAPTAHRATFILGNYSEFGLIVAAIAVSDGLLAQQWSLIIAVALSLSFLISAVLNGRALSFYYRYQFLLKRFERQDRLPEDQPIVFGDAQMIVFGMGRVGRGVYDSMELRMPGKVIGVDHDQYLAERHQAEGRKTIVGSASNPEFWDRVVDSSQIEYVMLVMPNHQAQMTAVKLIRGHGFNGRIAASAKYPDEVEALHEMGVEESFNLYAEAGSGFARHVCEKFSLDSESEKSTL